MRGLKGKKQFNNGVIARFFDPEKDEIPDGFVPGPLQKQIDRLKTISTNRVGKTASEEAKKNMSEAAKLRFSDSTNHPMYGKHQSAATKQKISNSKKGVPSKSCGPYTAEQKERRNQKIIEKYGSIEYYKELSALHRKTTNVERYGIENYSNPEKAKLTISDDPRFYEKRTAKTRETINSRYGNTQEWFQKRMKSYAVNNNFETIKAAIDHHCSMMRSHIVSQRTQLEERFRIFLSQNDIPYDEQVEVVRDDKRHTFDFSVYKDNKLAVLVDCDGQYYHGYVEDENGKSINTYVDDYRSTLVPNDVKFCIIVEGNEEADYAQFMKTYNQFSMEEYEQDIFDWCRSIGFPYPSYSKEVVMNSWKSLCNADCSKFSTSARYGEKVLLNSYPSIYHAHKNAKLSPYEGWMDDALLHKCIKNRIIYRGSALDPSKVLTGFTVSKIAPRVSIFNPYLAKYLINKYCNEAKTIFDPFSGYGGRLLGVAALGKTYIGQDINSTTIQESRNLVNSLKLQNVNLRCCDSLNTYGEYECLFTCSPYGKKEQWGNDPYIYSCDEWIDNCLQRFRCNKYVFVVDETTKYKNFVAETLMYKSHFGTTTEYVIVIDKNQIKLDAQPSAMDAQGDEEVPG